MWSVKLSYSLPGQDVLVAQFLGEENVLQLATYLFESEPDPVFIHPIACYINGDASRAEFYIHWESQEAFNNWYAVHGEDWEALIAESNAYGAEQGVVFERSYPPHEDYDWSNDSSSDMQLVSDVFLHLSNAKL